MKQKFTKENTPKSRFSPSPSVAGKKGLRTGRKPRKRSLGWFQEWDLQSGKTSSARPSSSTATATSQLTSLLNELTEAMSQLNLTVHSMLDKAATIEAAIAGLSPSMGSRPSGLPTKKSSTSRRKSEPSCRVNYRSKGINYAPDKYMTVKFT